MAKVNREDFNVLVDLASQVLFSKQSIVVAITMTATIHDVYTWLVSDADRKHQRGSYS